MIFLLLCGISILVFLFYALWTSSHWQRRGIKGPMGMPIVGNMASFLLGRKHYGEVYEDIYNQQASLPYIGIYRVFNDPAILLRSQPMIKEIMIRNFHNFEDNVLWVDPKRDPIIHCNPFVARGEQWRQMRAEILPIFTPNKVKTVFPHILAICQQLAEHVSQTKGSKDFEAKDLFSKYTLGVVASAAYGLDAQTFTNENSDFTQLVEHLFLPNPWSLIETTALLFSPLLGNFINYHYAPIKVQNWLNAIINQVLDKRLNRSELSCGAGTSSSSASSSIDFIQWLIEAKKRQQEAIDGRVIVGHCATFLLEGFETSSSLMAFALYEYAVNPNAQQRLLNEIDEVLARYNGELCYEAMQEMNYLEATLYETLRLHPPMLALLKQCTKPCKLPPQIENGIEFNVPKGTTFVVPVKAVHNDPELYPEPSKFKPERFGGQNEKQRQACAFLGFGEGPRMCPGMRFGLAQSKAGLITLLSKYSVHLAAKAKKPFQIEPKTFLTVAKDGVWIHFKPRK